MAAISLKLPDDLALESKEIAEKIGITRTELIRQALRHELDQIEAQLEKDAMARALQAMRTDPVYLQDSEALDSSLAGDLREEPEDWWKG